jgi:hypothetical protein
LLSGHVTGRSRAASLFAISSRYSVLSLAPRGAASRPKPSSELNLLLFATTTPYVLSLHYTLYETTLEHRLLSTISLNHLPIGLIPRRSWWTTTPLAARTLIRGIQYASARAGTEYGYVNLFGFTNDRNPIRALSEADLSVHSATNAISEDLPTWS